MKRFNSCRNLIRLEREKKEEQARDPSLSSPSSLKSFERKFYLFNIWYKIAYFESLGINSIKALLKAKEYDEMQSLKMSNLIKVFNSFIICARKPRASIQSLNARLNPRRGELFYFMLA